jgi:hypothetical protein
VHTVFFSGDADVSSSSLRTASSLSTRYHTNNRPSTLHSSAPPFDASLQLGYVPISPPRIRVPMASPLSMIRTKGEAGTGDVVEAVRHQRAVMSDIRRAAAMSDEELYAFAKELSAPYHLLKETARLKRLPVVSFAAGGVATPADAALMMQLGCDGVFVGSGICEW